MKANYSEEYFPDNDFKPLERKGLAERVADKLRDLVLLEKLQPGTIIPERETAVALGVSRTPLRESLRILASEGLIEIAPNRPPRVANPSLTEIKELLQVQGTLESLAGELACTHATESGINHIANIDSMMQKTSQQSKPDDLLAFFQLDMKFHDAIVAASGNTALLETHRMYNARLWRARFISSRMQINRAGTLSQHSDIVEALRTRDTTACAAALKLHLDTGYTNIEHVYLTRNPTLKHEN